MLYQVKNALPYQSVNQLYSFIFQGVSSSGNGQGELEEQLQNTQGLATLCVKGATYVSSLTAEMDAISKSWHQMVEIY